MTAWCYGGSPTSWYVSTAVADGLRNVFFSPKEKLFFILRFA